MWFAGFYPSPFLQSANGSKNSILNWVLKLNLFKSLTYFLCFCLEKPCIDFLFFYTIVFTLISFKYLQKTGLNNRFVISRENLFSCVQKIKNKHDGGTHVVVSFLLPRVTHSLVERVTLLHSNKDKNPGNEEA